MPLSAEAERKYKAQEEEKKKKEAAARQLRAKALAHLTAEGQSLKEIAPELHQAANVPRDNTLELLLSEKSEAEFRKHQQIAASAMTISANTTSSKLEAVSIGSRPGSYNKPSVAEATVNPTATPLASVGLEHVLPEPWQRVLDKNTGKYYYWNKSTNVTSWTPPECKVSSSVKSAGSGKTADNAFSGPWSEQRHPGTGQVYYVNRITGEKRSSAPSVEEEEEAAMAALLGNSDSLLDSSSQSMSTSLSESQNPRVSNPGTVGSSSAAATLNSSNSLPGDTRFVLNQAEVGTEAVSRRNTLEPCSPHMEKKRKADSNGVNELLASAANIDPLDFVGSGSKAMKRLDGRRQLEQTGFKGKTANLP